MEHLERALYFACKAFLGVYENGDEQRQAEPQHPAFKTESHVKESNGIPVCPHHDKAMKAGQYGYYCTSKEDRPDLANKNGFCNYKAR